MNKGSEAMSQAISGDMPNFLVPVGRTAHRGDVMVRRRQPWKHSQASSHGSGTGHRRIDRVPRDIGPRPYSRFFGEHFY
jgi:hypothetical protein